MRRTRFGLGYLSLALAFATGVLHAGEKSSGVKGIVERVREAYPDLVTVAVNHRELAAELLEKSTGDAVDSGSGGKVHPKLLAAELYEAIGEGATARRLWAEIVKSGDPVQYKAEALHALGLHYMLRQRYVDTWKYWKHLPALVPDTVWVTRTERFAPFLRVASQLRECEKELADARKDGSPVPEVSYPALPDFAGDFGELGMRSRADLLGGWVVLDFWASTAPGARDEAAGLHLDIERARGRGWQGVVLGVNVDRSRADFEKAVADWKTEAMDPKTRRRIKVQTITWPQHHDGFGFDSPIVRALGIPRVPMRLAIDPSGKVVFLTRPRARLAPILEP